MSEAVTSRSAQRRTTQKRILDAARTLFAERGFDRTTIRAVAALASVDPRLVSHYYGSKGLLFTAAVRHHVGHDADGDPVAASEAMLTSLGMKISGLPETSIAMLRSMLTHPEAAELARREIDDQIRSLAATIRADDAAVRAALLLATTIGITVARELLKVSELRAASPSTIAAILEPAFHALTTGGDAEHQPDDGEGSVRPAPGSQSRRIRRPR
ncbi:DNA-binding transcriptional regulator, AcrR family [Nakamurella panacisegetis]|uniref:DNA-binding transcriptional regulator, AcrR family n=1 Tax=Nakamurella panacisegetis TaxID=1090615 RepID=A0A1H0LDP0_9ACTN|nr:TetR/AcrR family transcriptional regulator [Nakamurella panacisegetis]SDO66090.1 DNA-binding transcriptional regulator, AcrR family [Nakamurella panacisegetis]